jgi:archaellum biogenesis ATPase FlaH
MTRPQYIEQIHDILDETYYDSEAMKWVVQQCKEYFVKYNKSITFDVFKVKIGEVKNDVLKTTVVETLKEVYQHLESPDLDFVQDRSVDFLKNQTLKSAIIESVEILERDGDFEKIKIIIDNAMKAGTERNIGHEYFNMVDERYEEMARPTIETPWEVVNGLTQGGLASGELGVIVAPAGVGKTWVLAAIGAGAVKNKKTVIHYTLELNEAYVGLRYDSIFTGIANQNLKYHKEDVEKKIEPIEGELLIKYYPTKTASVHSLASHLQRTKMLHKNVDLVIVDYADILRDVHSAKEVRHQLGNIYEDLRGLAGELQIPIWTASQANRSSLDEDVIEAQKISESYIKIMTADFVMSVSRKVEDKIANTGRFHIIKNRFGPDGLTYPAKINTNTGHIEIYEGDSVGGREQQHKINNRDNITKKLLSNKYEELML